jgi:uncharacterized protein
MITSFLLGLFGSFHCIGMCGSIVLSLPYNNASSQSLSVLQYNLGRILAYAVLGLIFGVFGKGLIISGVQQWVSVLAGILLIISVFIPKLIGIKWVIFKPLQFFYSKLKKKLSYLFKSQSKFRLLGIGFLNGFLPCGLVYIALVGALLSNSVIDAVLTMLMFGLGTSPSLIILMYSSKMISVNLKQKITKFIPVFIVLLGLIFLLRGLGLGIPYISPDHEVLKPEITQESCH